MSRPPPAPATETAKANLRPPAAALAVATVAATAAGSRTSTSAAKTATVSPAPTAAFDNFARWADQFMKAGANPIEGQRLAWERREAMLDLIQSDPAKALSLAAPYAWRQELPPEVTRFFEQQLDGRGNYKVAMATDFSRGSSTVIRTVELGGSNYQAFVYGRRLSQPCLARIPLHGIALAGKMAVASDSLRRLTPAEAVALAGERGRALDKFCGVSGNPVVSRGQPVYAESGGGILCFCGTDHYDLVNKQWALAESGGTAAAGETPVGGVGVSVNDAWTHGVKSLLYMRVNFPDDLTEPISEADAYSVMDQVNRFYTTVSYNLTALDTTVAPLVTLPQTKAYYSTDPGLLLADARAATKLAGYDTANYDRDIVAFTTVPNYGFGGLAYVGGKGVWLQSMGSGVTAHELGHNYGLFHANFWDATTNFSSFGPGTNLEYGNINDTMGAAGAGSYQFNAAHKSKLDWLKADAVQTITSNGVYRVYPFDVPATARVAGRMYAGAVQKDSLRYYWLEFRQLFPDPWMQNGLLLNWSPWPESNGGTQLIDTTPGSPDRSDSASRSDAAVVIGRTFNDNPAGVHITPLQRGADGSDPWIDYRVNLGLFPSNHPPVLSVEIDSNQVPVGSLIHLHAVAADPDGDTLAYAWSFDDLTFSTNNLPWTSKAFSTAGDHVIRCVVSDMKGGEASANVVVTVGSPGGFRITGKITDTNGVPLEGVLVGNGAIDASEFVGGWTDSDGRYVLVNFPGDGMNLNAYQFGYAFAGATNWYNPVQPTNDTSGVDFVATAMTTVNVTVDTNAVAESDPAAHYFTVTRMGDTNYDLAVYVALAGSATFGSDYILDTDLTATNLIVIPAGTNSITFTFHTRNDSLAEGPETATLTVVDDLNYAAPAYALAPPAEATITILDDDQPSRPAVTVATTTPEISENGIDYGEFVFTRVGSQQNDLLVNYSVSGTALPGTDFAPLAGSVIIPAGQSSASVFVQTLDDHSVESNETLVVTVAASAAYTVGNPASDTITIFDDGATTVTVFPVQQPAAEPSTPGAFMIKRDGDLSASLTVNYLTGGTALPGVDYIPLSGTVTIPAGSDSTTVSFTPLNDGTPTADTYVTLSLTNDYNYDVGTPGSASISITESASPAVSISAPISSVSEQGNAFGQFKISRANSTGNLTVHLAISGTAVPGWNYLPLDNPVVIPDGSSSITLDVIPFQDAILDPDLTVQLTVLDNTNYSVVSGNTATVTITDDGTSQVPGVGFCFATSAVPESQSPGIAVALSVTSAVPVTVDYKVIGGTAPSSRYSLPSGTLSLPTNGFVGFIPLKIVNDATVEPPQTIQVVLFNPTNATLNAIRVHTYTILDDDSSVVSVAATVPNASEIGPVAGNFRITRAGSTNAAQPVAFQITGSASAPTDYLPLGTSATIPAGASYVDLPVIPVDDHTPELSQTVVLTLISATNGSIVSPASATITISSNDTNPLPVVAVSSTNQPYAVAGGGNGAFVFTRTGDTGSNLVVSFTIGGTAPASRYAALPGFVTIPAGQASVTLPVVALDDHVVRGDQTVTVTLAQAETYRSAYPAAATVIVQDADQAVWIDASDFQASKVGPDPGEFTFSRFGTTNLPVTIYYTISGTASNGFDYFLITNSVVIPAGQLTASLPILPLHTGKPVGLLTAVLSLVANAAYVLDAPADATVTIDDDMPMVTITNLVANVLEGGETNGIFRLTRTGDPQFDFTAYLAVGGSAVFNLDYAGFATNVYFSCGVTSIDLTFPTFNNGLADGDKSVTAALIPNPSTYTILAPSNAVILINDAGADETPIVTITKPAEKLVYLIQTNRGIILKGSVITASTNYTVSWAEQDGNTNAVFDNTNAIDTGVLFLGPDVYHLRLTADDGVLQGHDEITIVTGPAQLIPPAVLFWPFDEGTGTGTNVTDLSGGGHNGVLVGSPQWVTNGVAGAALRFSGTNDYVRQSAGKNLLEGGRAFTLSLWIRSMTTNLDQGFFTASAAGGATLSLATRSHATCGNYTNVIEATIATTGGILHRISASNAAVTNQWQNLILTWSNGLAPQLYINGQRDQPTSQESALAGTLTNCPDFIVGKGPDDSPSSWRGLIDEVYLFPTVLTSNEIVAIGSLAPPDETSTNLINAAPLVDAGTNQTIQILEPFLLAGTASDDGLPNPPAQLVTTWEQLYTNTVMIADTNSLTNTITFNDAGDYTFRLTADDSDIATFANVTITAILPTEVDIYADMSDAYELGPVSGDFTLMRNGATNDLTVYLAISGTASNGVDYVTLTNTVTFADGSNSVSFPVLPYLDYEIEGDESVIVTIVTNPAYFIGSGNPATVTIHDSPYGLWSIQHFTLEQLTHPELSGPGASFTSDGIANFAKYAFNLDPAVSNTPPPYVWDLETDTNDSLQHLTLTYTRWLPPRDVQYGVFVSTNLVNWLSGSNYVEEFSVSPDPNGTTETVKARALTPVPGSTNLFMNIRVWLQQVPGP